jgi:hypothetical protein
MAASTPTRIDEDLFAAAKSAGEVLSRSAAQQINHWARIGRELEASEAVSARDIARVLTGQSPYDDLGVREQAIVRAEWDHRMAELRTGINLEDEFTAAGQTWAEADPQGNTVESGTQTAAAPAARRGPRSRRSAS